MDLSELQQKIKKRQTVLEDAGTAMDVTSAEAEKPVDVPGSIEQLEEECSEACSSPITKQFNRSGSLRYHNTAWQSNTSRSRGGAGNRNSQIIVDSTSSSTVNSNAKVPPPAPPRRGSVITTVPINSAPLVPHTQQGLIEEERLEVKPLVLAGDHPTSPTAPSPRSPHGVKYNTLHVYLHGAPLGAPLAQDFTPQQRMLYIQEKFDDIKHILNSVGIVISL